MSNFTSTKTVALVAAAFSGLSAYAQVSNSLLNIKAVKTGEPITMLDSVKSDNYRKYYKYNEYGYITSVMTYRKDVLDAESSYQQDYVFDADGQCTQRTRYSVDENGKRLVPVNQGKLEVKDGLTWEYTYSRKSDGKMHPSTAKAYDQFGNLAIDIEYAMDSSNDNADYIISYSENRYSKHVDESHYNFYALQNRYLTYSFKASSGYIVRTMNPEELPASSCTKVVWEKADGKLYYKYYTMPWSSSGNIITKGNVDNYLVLSSEDIYELNAEGTRPVRRTSLSNFGGASELVEYASCEYGWDDKNRLISEVKTEASRKDVVRNTVYTYADDYAVEMSLQDAVNEVRQHVYLYPEDKYCTFGRLATQHKEKIDANNPDEIDTEDITITWDSEGRVTAVKEVDIDKDPDKSADLRKDKEIKEDRYFYNANNHADYILSLEVEYAGDTELERKYAKDVFKYNKLGVWVGMDSGDSSEEDSWKEEFNKSSNATVASLQSAPNTDDMTDGYHQINSEEGVFMTSGAYEVSGGQIIYGYYHQYIKSTGVRVPSNPEYNYTDPQVPLESDDEEVGYGTMTTWSYYWNTSSQSWECVSAPSEVEYVYKNGSDIVCDIYNGEQQKVGTTTYSFDNEGRLIKQVGTDKEVTYTYLEDDSNYLLESTTTEGGVSDVKHFYYSLHNYVNPTGVEDVKAATVGEDVYYDLQGRRIKNPSAHGIYIVNGKKVMK